VTPRRPSIGENRLAGRRIAWSAFRSWLAQSTSRTIKWTSAPVAVMLYPQGGGTPKQKPAQRAEQHAEVVIITAEYAAMRTVP
jgi:hypothetical protein